MIVREPNARVAIIHLRDSIQSVVGKKVSRREEPTIYPVSDVARRVVGIFGAAAVVGPVDMLKLVALRVFEDEAVIEGAIRG